MFVHRALQDLPVTIWGDGETVRDYFYIGDLAQALLVAGSLSSDAVTNAVFNIGGERGYTLNQLGFEIEETLGISMDVRYEPARKFDVPVLQLDWRRASEQLGWRPTIRLSEGIRQTAEWLKRWQPSLNRDLNP